MDEEVKLNWSRFEAALMQRVASSKRLAEELLKEQARSLFRTVVEITPPGHAGAPAGSRAATTAGQNKVASDIAKLYGTTGTAFDLIAAKSEPDARVFWAMKTKRPDAASDIVRKHLDAWYGPFDDGKLHKERFKGGRVRGGRRKAPIYIIHQKDQRALKEYLRQQQAHVNWLASGWKRIANALGIHVAQAIARHSAPGVATITATMERILIRATNEVGYASDVDLRRRIQSAIDRQVGAMERQWKFFLEQQFVRQLAKAA